MTSTASARPEAGTPIEAAAAAFAPHSAALPILLALVTQETGSTCIRTAMLLSFDHVLETAAIKIARQVEQETTPKRQIAAMFDALPALSRLANRRHPFALRRNDANARH